MDLPVDQSSKLNVSQAQSLKQTIEKSLGSDNVVIDINQLSSDDMQMQPLMRQMRLQKIGISQMVLFGIQTIKTHQLILISLRQHQMKTLRPSWDMITQIMWQQPK